MTMSPPGLPVQAPWCKDQLGAGTLDRPVGARHKNLCKDRSRLTALARWGPKKDRGPPQIRGSGYPGAQMTQGADAEMVAWPPGHKGLGPWKFSMLGPDS